MRIGAQRREVEEASHPGTGRGAGQTAHALHMDRIEALPSALLQDAHQIDDRVDALHGCGDRTLMANIGGDGHDLGDVAQWLQEKGMVRPAHGDAHDPAALGQPLHDVAADETRSAENRRYGGRHEFSPISG